jgi:transposase
MMQNQHLAKSIQDAGWDVLERILHAKANEWDREMVKVDPVCWFTALVVY